MAPSYSAMGTIGGPDFAGRTMTQAATAAETAAFSSSRGRAARCSRGMGSVTPVECASLFLVSQEDETLAKNCARELGCSTGRLKAQKLLSGEIMSREGKCANQKCPNSKKRVTLPAKGLCGKCYAQTRTGDLEWPPLVEKPAEADPLAMRESSLLSEAEMAAVQDHFSQLGKMVDPMPDHIVEPNKMVTDFSAPFSFGGFEFDPGVQPTPPGQPSIRLSTSGNLHISSAATKTFGLLRYKFVRITPDKTGTALAMIFSAETVPGARSLAAERKSPYALKASARQVARIAPAVVGKTLELRSMGQDGALLAVAVEEVA